MEQITLEQLNIDLVRQLESTLTRLAMSSESNLSTYTLEDKAKKLASKLKNSLEVFSGLSIWKDVKENNTVYHPESAFTDTTFAKYAYLCKKTSEALTVYKDDSKFFAKISDGLYVNIEDIPEQQIYQFKVKIEGSTLMAVRSDLLAKLPSGIKELLGGKDDE
jgi:hypothetical protein